MNALIALATASAVTALTVEESHVGKFNNWKNENNKTYKSIEEETARFEVFMENNARIEKHNSNGNNSYSLEHNMFSDLTAEEFKGMMNGYVPSTDKATSGSVHVVGTDIPASKDWREENVVTAVKNQGQCGSCWAFSTTGSVEGANLIKNGGSPSEENNILSEQELVDCSTVNLGCSGGLMDDAFDYLIAKGTKGDDTESTYPYKGRDGRCRAQKGKASNIQVTSFVDVPASEEALKHAVGTVGPISIAIEADQSGFQFYSEGVFSGTCGQQLDHGVLVVGYDTDESGQDYWIVKNSWGPEWGMDGYIKIAIGENLCGISNQASYPIVA